MCVKCKDEKEEFLIVVLFQNVLGRRWDTSVEGRSIILWEILLGRIDPHKNHSEAPQSAARSSSSFPCSHTGRSQLPQHTKTHPSTKISMPKRLQWHSTFDLGFRPNGVFKKNYLCCAFRCPLITTRCGGPAAHGELSLKTLKTQKINGQGLIFPEKKNGLN